MNERRLVLAKNSSTTRHKAVGMKEPEFMSHSDRYDVIIAGAGPAGASAAIHLALNGVKVLLLEQKKFPRPKLCGEFISPECRPHFDRLGVTHQMTSSGSTEIGETVFYSLYGNRITVPSSWFGPGAAMGLSRAEMDHNLLARAKEVGAVVVEDAAVSRVIQDNHAVVGVELASTNNRQRFYGDVTIDATGRAAVLTRKVESSSRRTTKRKLVAFKAHLEDSRGDRKACEIYSYPGGYGGLSTIENGLSNLCFIVDANVVKAAHSDPDAVVRDNLKLNPRAAQTLSDARVTGSWLSVALESFGRQKVSQANGLLSIGDSAAFIDPFTGSGMLMALESGELVARSIVRLRNELSTNSGLNKLASSYADEYEKVFKGRLRFCGMLRRVAFKPRIAQLTITLCSVSDSFRSWVVRSTRASGSDKHDSAVFGE
jgi:flavin-dependent dehydrogenase